MKMLAQQRWIPKTKNPQTSLPVRIPPPSFLFHSEDNSHQTEKMPTGHQNLTLFATKNPPQILALIHLLTQIHPLSISCPIFINNSPLLHENLSDNYTRVASQEKSSTIRLLTTFPVSPLPKSIEVIELPLMKVYPSPSVRFLYTYYKMLLTSFSSPQTPSLSHKPFSLGPEIMGQAQQLKILGCSTLKQLNNFDSHSQPALMQPSQHASLPASENTSLVMGLIYSLDMPAPSLTETHAPPHSLPSNITQETTPMDFNPSPNAPQTDTGRKGKKKLDQIPMRRSQRLRDKHCVSATSNKTAERKTRYKRTTISFEASSTQSPLDIDRTLQILQATGLQIDKHIEMMIEEAVKKDQDNEKIDHSRPTTPLHDPVPPITVPQFDLPL